MIGREERDAVKHRVICHSEKKKNKTCILIYIMVSKGKNQTKSVIYSHETPQVLSVGVMLDIMFKESHYVGHSLALVGPRGSLSE